jgi:translation initiation factor IF-1
MRKKTNNRKPSIPTPQVPGYKAMLGTVTEALPNTLFRVLKDENQEEIIGFLAGKMRLHRIKVLVGDRVELEPNPYGGKQRIVKRL